MVGVIYNPILDEMFSAIVGCGATCNGKPIKASKNATGTLMTKSLLLKLLNGPVKHVHYYIIYYNVF